MACKVIRRMLETAKGHLEMFRVVVHLAAFTLADQTMIQPSAVSIGMASTRVVVVKSSPCIQYQTNKAAIKSSKSSKKITRQRMRAARCRG